MDVPVPKFITTTGAESPGRFALRRNYLTNGASALTDTDLVRLLLEFATPQRRCDTPAAELVHRFGGFRGVLEAPPHLRRETRGISAANGILLDLVRDAATRYLEQRVCQQPSLSSPRDAADWLQLALAHRQCETVAAVYLNARHRVLELRELFRGSVRSTVVFPREVLARALVLGATGLILAHNHPSGAVEPSEEDVRLTRDLLRAATTLDLMLVDHLIVGSGGWYSFAENGLLSSLAREAA